MTKKKRTTSQPSFGSWRFPERGSWVVLRGAGDLAVPQRSSVRVDDPALPYFVDLEIVVPVGADAPNAYASSVAVVAREDGTVVDGNALRRIRVGEYITKALLSKAQRLSFQPRDEVSDEAWRSKLAPRGGGKGPTDADLERVAMLYREALADPNIRNKPTQYVADKFPAARSTAARYVQAARNKKYLGPALDRRAGEAK